MARHHFLTSLGLDPFRWMEPQIAHIGPDTKFVVFSLPLKPHDAYAKSGEWRCRFERKNDWDGVSINGFWVAANVRVAGFRFEVAVKAGFPTSFQELDTSGEHAGLCKETRRTSQGKAKTIRSSQSRLSAFPNLTSLRLCGGKNHRLSLKAFVELGLTNLSSLDLWGWDSLTDLSPLIAITNLAHLRLWGGASLRSVAPLAKLANLTSLELSDCDLADLRPLAGLTKLSSLNLNGCLKVVDLRPLAELTNLLSLDLSGCAKVADLRPLAGLTKLISLNLLGCDNVADLEPLEKLTQLERLNLCDCKSLMDIGPLAGLINLSSLDLSRCDLADLRPLEGLIKLSSLDLSYLRSDEPLTDLSPLEVLKQLTHINLSKNGSLKDLNPLAGLPNVSSLDLKQCESLSDLRPLAKLGKLRRLNLSSCHSLSSLGPLAGLNQLCGLSLETCRSLTDIHALSTLQQLEWLDLRECRYLNLARLQPLFRSLGLKQLQIEDLAFRFKVLLNAACGRSDSNALLALLIQNGEGEVQTDYQLYSDETLLTLQSSSDAQLAVFLAKAIGAVGAGLPVDYCKHFLDVCRGSVCSLDGEGWGQILRETSRSSPDLVAAWLNALSASPSPPAAVLAGLLDLVANGVVFLGLDWVSLLDALLPQASFADQLEVGPQVCLAWHVLREPERELEWYKRLTNPNQSGFRDRVLVRFALHDIREGRISSVNRLLAQIESMQEADTVRTALARALATTSPNDAGKYLEEVFEEADRRALAAELMAVPSFTGVELNLNRLIVILGTDPERFHRLLDLMLERHPDSEWLLHLRKQLAPASSVGVAESLLSLLAHPAVRKRTKETRLKRLQDKLLAQPMLVDAIHQAAVVRLLQQEELIDDDEAQELLVELGNIAP